MASGGRSSPLRLYFPQRMTRKLFRNRAIRQAANLIPRTPFPGVRVLPWLSCSPTGSGRYGAHYFRGMSLPFLGCALLAQKLKYRGLVSTKLDDDFSKYYERIGPPLPRLSLAGTGTPMNAPPIRAPLHPHPGEMRGKVCIDKRLGTRMQRCFPVL